VKALWIVPATCIAVLLAVPGPALATTISISSATVTPSADGPLFAGTGVTVMLGASSGYVSPLQYGSNLSDPQGWDPWGGSDTNSYWISVGGAGVGYPSSQTLNFLSPVDILSLLWGSPNSNNTITLSNGQTIAYVDNLGFEIDGVLTTGPYPNVQTGPASSGYIVTITSSPFTSAVLSNGIGGFEVADISAAAPLPSSWTMMLIGFVGLGFFAYRGTKKSAAVLAAA
jgi:hypothetical protein